MIDRYSLGVFAIGVLMFAESAQAIAPQATPGLLSTEIARPLMEQDFGVRAARAGIEAGLAEARGLKASPYDFNVKLSGQQRDVRNDSKYDEWNGGLERTIRLPGKASADRKLAATAIEQSEAAVGEALHESARNLMSLWVDWLKAERAYEIATASMQSFGGSLTAVEKRARAGDASKLDIGTAKAEVVEQRRLANDAKTAAWAAWTRLSTRFPGIARDVTSLPMPMPISADTTEWHQRIVQQSDELKLTKLSAQRAKEEAQRARADRFADPTLGAFTASEVGGRERFTGVAVTIPIGMPGGYRSAQAAKAVADAESADYEAQLKEREFSAEIAAAFVDAQGSYDSLMIANEGASAMAENANLMDRAYTLGEADLQDLLIVRRQAFAAANNALEAQATALKAYYTLVIDAHWVWDLEHE